MIHGHRGAEQKNKFFQENHSLCVFSLSRHPKTDMKPSLRHFRVPLRMLLLAGLSFLSLGMMSLDVISRDWARELGAEIRVTSAGPHEVRVELELKTEGALKNFSRVELELTDGKKLLVTSTLREERPSLGRVVVGFATGKTNLEKITLKVVTGKGTRDQVSYDLKLKAILDPGKTR